MDVTLCRLRSHPERGTAAKKVYLGCWSGGGERVERSGDGHSSQAESPGRMQWDLTAVYLGTALVASCAWLSEPVSVLRCIPNLVRIKVQKMYSHFRSSVFMSSERVTMSAA
jgi:hypothetical protein